MQFLEMLRTVFLGAETQWGYRECHGLEGQWCHHHARYMVPVCHLGMWWDKRVGGNRWLLFWMKLGLLHPGDDGYCDCFVWGTRNDRHSRSCPRKGMVRNG